MRKKIMVLGSGELGKEFVIAAQRIGQYTIAVDNYADAPAMQVAHRSAVINMLDGDALDKLVNEYQPDIIVPEIEALRTECLYEYESRGIQVVPSAKAANFTMNRKAIRDLAADELGLQTAPYRYAATLEDLHTAVEAIGYPCVVKPLMSSSGKGQSVLKSKSDIAPAWEAATMKGRGDQQEVIVEGFIDFNEEITLLTVTQHQGQTLFCPPIGHRQERGDYQESWQPANISSEHLRTTHHMAAAVTEALGGTGIWGVEFFLTADGVYFSELSPRPHDTGMVTLAGTQPYNEFELHLRAILGMPIPGIPLLRAGASAVILAHTTTDNPTYEGLLDASELIDTDFRLFGKPATRPYRRMGVALAYGPTNMDLIKLRQKARRVADTIKVY